MNRRLLSFILLCAMLLLASGLQAFAQTTPANVSTPQTAALPTYAGYTEPQYKDASLQSLYVTMRDGVKIAIDVALPKDTPANTKLPTVMQLTRYHRSNEANGLDGIQKFFTSYGYAVVSVDARGTGASFGLWTMPWAKEEIADGGEIVSWIVAQTWSNGKVGAVGNSYGGTSAQMLAVPNHTAVKAVIPRHYEFDVYTDIAFPGGVFNEWMIKNWNQANNELDTKPGVKPVAADKDKAMLGEALKMHTGNINIHEAASKMVFRDDRPFSNFSIDDFSVHSFRQQVEQSGAAINNWGSWLDAGTADGMIRSFMTFKNPQRTVIGAWNHGASQYASPYSNPKSEGVRQRFEWLRFFDHYLKGVDTKTLPDRTLYYFTMGEEKWKSTKSWPPAGSETVRGYFGADNMLMFAAPTTDAGSDRYTVDFEATTGMKNRWTTQLGGQVTYPDRAEEDKRLVTYTSAPLTEDTEITGYPVITLQVASTVSDSAFFIYLEDVDETGKVTYLTEGQLRAIHRKVSKDKPPYWLGVPYHSFKRRDALPLVAGEMAEVKFGLLPVSVLIKKGHRLRVAIAGHDKSVFARIPASGTPVFTFERNKRHASFIELPVIKNSGRRNEPVNLLTVPIGNVAR